MLRIAPEVMSIAGACLGGLQGRSALLVGPEEQRAPFIQLLKRAQMKYIYEEDTPRRLPDILPHVQLLISVPARSELEPQRPPEPLLTAASIARGCAGRRTPLLIFDLAPDSSVEELAGLLPSVCLYTPNDLRHILSKAEVKVF
ncbi:MAG TPA: hypothetical protein VKY19_19105 [Ktedonosporobacter sp.]|nr:hypothetical protein [Ktedonosporobacter sp.]